MQVNALQRQNIKLLNIIVLCKHTQILVPAKSSRKVETEACLQLRYITFSFNNSQWRISKGGVPWFEFWKWNSSPFLLDIWLQWLHNAGSPLSHFVLCNASGWNLHLSFRINDAFADVLVSWFVKLCAGKHLGGPFPLQSEDSFPGMTELIRLQHDFLLCISLSQMSSAQSGHRFWASLM